MTATLSVVYETADVELDGFRLGYVAEDGTQHRLSPADAWAVRFEAMSPARQDYRRAQACCRDLEQDYGLHRVGGRRTGERYPTGAELNKTTRQRRGEVPRDRLRHVVHAAANTASNERDFLDRLRISGLLVRPRANTTQPNHLAGYALALPDDHNAAGDTIWYSGSTLAADLSLPNLRRRWRSP